MRVTYDRDADAAYIYLEEIQAGGVDRTVPVDPSEISGMINLDFGKDGKLLGIEVLDASRFLSEQVLIQSE